MDYERFFPHASLPVTPDLLITPSDLKYFVKVGGDANDELTFAGRVVGRKIRKAAPPLGSCVHGILKLLGLAPKNNPKIPVLMVFDEGWAQIASAEGDGVSHAMWEVVVRGGGVGWGGGYRDAGRRKKKTSSPRYCRIKFGTPCPLLSLNLP